MSWNLTMKIAYVTESLTAFDAKTILYLRIDKPLDTGSVIYDYLIKYSNTCYCFARNKLYNYLLNQYITQYKTSRKEFAYFYDFSIRETYLQNEIASYLFITSLSSIENIVAQGTDSVIFYKEHILDPRMIYQRINKNKGAVFLDKNCKPSLAYTKDLRIITKTIKNTNYKFKNAPV